MLIHLSSENMNDPRSRPDVNRGKVRGHGRQQDDENIASAMGAMQIGGGMTCP